MSEESTYTSWAFFEGAATVAGCIQVPRLANFGWLISITGVTKMVKNISWW